MNRDSSSSPAAVRTARRGAREGFTLIELLVVMSILALLLTILMPSLSRARELAMRVVCGSNLRSCTQALTAYAASNRYILPAASGNYSDGSPFYTQPLSSNRFIVRGWDNWTPDGYVPMDYDLRALIRPYLDGVLEVWMCPSLNVPSIGDSGNTRGICYGPYLYFGGDIDNSANGHPDFGVDKQVRLRLSQAPSSLPLIQDRASDRRNWNGAWSANHLVNGWTAAPLDENPSNPRNYTNNQDDVSGANIARYDGSARWHDMAGLVNIGDDEWQDNNLVYSVWP